MGIDPECTRCGLSRFRNRIVMPDGDMRSPVCFVGEAPGKMEDLEGRPFVGRAGRMLDRLLMEEGLPRSKIMITNTVKCRPPGNRVPTREERLACRPYLEEELEGRKVVVTLGRTASSNLIGREVKLEEEANKPRELIIGKSKVIMIPAYHPAACLFNIGARESLRKTIRLVKQYLQP